MWQPLINLVLLAYIIFLHFRIYTINCELPDIYYRLRRMEKEFCMFGKVSELEHKLNELIHELKSSPRHTGR